MHDYYGAHAVGQQVLHAVVGRAQLSIGMDHSGTLWTDSVDITDSPKDIPLPRREVSLAPLLDAFIA